MNDKNVLVEFALIVSMLCLFAAMFFLCIWSAPTTTLPGTETPLQRTIYPDMHQDYP